jgi:hypothetical protein
LETTKKNLFSSGQIFFGWRAEISWWVLAQCFTSVSYRRPVICRHSYNPWASKCISICCHNISFEKRTISTLSMWVISCSTKIAVIYMCFQSQSFLPAREQKWRNKPVSFCYYCVTPNIMMDKNIPNAGKLWNLHVFNFHHCMCLVLIFIKFNFLDSCHS